MADDSEQHPDQTWAAVPPPPPPLPPPLALEGPEAEVQVVRRGGGRGRLIVTAVVVGGLLAGGLAFIASRGDDVDPDRALAAAQDVAQGSGSFRFELLQVSRVEVGEAGGAGSDTTTRSVTTGAVAGPDTWKITEDLGMLYADEPEIYETIRVGDTAYTDNSFPMGDVPGPSWVTFPADGMDVTPEELAQMYEDLQHEQESYGEMPEDDAFKLDLVLGAYSLGVDALPTDITRLVTDATEPAVEERLSDGGIVLRTRLAPVAELAEVADVPIPPVDLMLELDEDDRPVLARFTTAAGSATADVEVRFSDWGADIVVEPPVDGDIDHTPWIQEEALSQAGQTLMLAPSALPPGMGLTDASVWEGDPEFGECPSVNLTYSPEEEAALMDPEADLSTDELSAAYEELDYLYINVSSLSCQQELVDAPFDQQLGGLPARAEEGYWEVQVGDAVVYVDSTFGDDLIGPLVASLRPVTVAELAAAVPDWIDEYAAASLG
jgi:hypothetical protein